MGDMEEDKDSQGETGLLENVCRAWRREMWEQAAPNVRIAHPGLYIQEMH